MGCLKLTYSEINDTLKVAYSSCKENQKYYTGSYRYGFNGKEKDDEIKGGGNSIDFGERMYDSRLGRWLSIDKLSSKYPYYSPYNAMANNPILFVDIDGRDNIIYLVYIPDKNPKAQKVNAYDIAKEANANYEKMGLNTRVVVVDQSITGKNPFDAAKIDKTDAVAVIGNKNDVKDYIKKNDKTPSGFETTSGLDSWDGGIGNPELSENFTGGKGDDNARGGDFIAIDVNGLGSTKSTLGVGSSKAAALLLMHGAGHNADDKKFGLGHRDGVMEESINNFGDKNKYKGGYNDILKVENKDGGRNNSFMNHMKERFGNNKAKVNYNAKSTPIKD